MFHDKHFRDETITEIITIRRHVLRVQRRIITQKKIGKISKGK